MSDRYKGAILSPTAPTVTPQSAGGIYTSSQQLQYQGQGVWPTAFNNPLTNSLRFRQSASAWLNRTFGTPTLSTKWTWSGWFKLGSLTGTNKIIFDGGSPDTRFVLQDISNGPEQLIVGNDTTTFLATSAVYRDYSAWYHAVLAFDSSQGTASNRLRLYINGSEVTAFATDNRSSISGAIGINTATAHGIGKQPAGGVAYFDGYLAEINFVDGQQLTPSSFGETSTSTGVWIPKKYTGTYGTNGFYLPFTDTTSTSTLGTDFSGNSNTWTVNNISLTSGSTYDSMTDVPTLTSATAANYCVLNPLQNNGTLTNGNLTLSTSTSTTNVTAGTIGVSSGKWYWEWVASSNGGIASIGISLYLGTTVLGDYYLYQADTGNKDSLAGVVSYGATYTTGDVMGVALDLDNGTLTFYKNNTSQGVAYTSLPSGNYFAQITDRSVGGVLVGDINFGQRPFAYTPPTGFVALNTFNLPTPTIGATASTTANKYFDVSLYTGNGSTQSITNSGSMQPDWAWIKVRSSAASHALADSVRGSTVQLASNLTDAEITRADTVTSFNSNGFSLGANTTGYSVNLNTATYVAWQWRASNTTAVTNTAGSITSTVSANTTAGFSIVTYTGTGSNATVGHGLGVAPSMIIIKNRPSTGDTWAVWHTSFGGASNTDYLSLNGTGAKGWAGALALWNGTLPTSTVFSVGTYSASNENTKGMVAYCFAQVAGYSAFGSYTGNGSTDGVFLYTGFRPRYILIKRTNDVSDWWIWDTARNTINVMDSILYPNDSAAEYVSSSIFGVDALSNGFKMRTSNSVVNGSSQSYIYMAFAESPFKYANAR